MKQGKANHSCSKVSFREPGARMHTLLLSPGVCRGVPGSVSPTFLGIPSPFSSSLTQATRKEPWAAKLGQWEAKQMPQGRRHCLRTTVFLGTQGRRPGEQPAGRGRTLTGFQRPPRVDAQAFSSLYGSDQIKTNLKEMFLLVAGPLICTICLNSNYILRRGGGAFYCL